MAADQKSALAGAVTIDNEAVPADNPADRTEAAQPAPVAIVVLENVPGSL